MANKGQPDGGTTRFTTARQSVAGRGRHGWQDTSVRSGAAHAFGDARSRDRRRFRYRVRALDWPQCAGSSTGIADAFGPRPNQTTAQPSISSYRTRDRLRQWLALSGIELQGQSASAAGSQVEDDHLRVLIDRGTKLSSDRWKTGVNVRPFDLCFRRRFPWHSMHD